MNEDLVRRLRAADPAARVALPTAADDAMREAIMATDVTTDRTGTVGRRRVRRGAVVAALATVLVGGGAAYAGFHDWYRGGGGVQGLTCMARWDAPADERSGGPWLSGDAVADCRRYQELTGLPPIEQPVAFHVADDPATYVAPRDEVPQGATLVAADPQDLARQELEGSLGDLVDGLGAQCLDEAGAVAAAHAELDRLGLEGWTVRSEERPADWPEEECALVGFAFPQPPADGATAAPGGTATPANGREAFEPEPRTLVVHPHAAPDRDTLRGQGVGEVVYEIRDALRAGIADACVDLDVAERIAADALGDGHHWPTVVVEDPAAECTRVDLTGGGSIQVSLRGPRR
ncbi:hypothetical protein [Cellulomonas sp.]|uniref:hypothetical protein n=1 Tax=Cellulomonas sp. TaxID=40001 RepID=UPI0028118052|nr:hypothetical protein [Cellulomonas sp.]